MTSPRDPARSSAPPTAGRRGIGGRGLVLVILVAIAVPALFLWHRSHVARRELARELEAVRAEGAGPPAGVPRAVVVALDDEREPGEEPRIAPPAEGSFVVFAFEPPDDAGGSAEGAFDERLVLRRGEGDGGAVVWRGPANEAGAGTWVVTLHASRLPPGDYRFSAEPESPGPAAPPVYRFRVAAPAPPPPPPG